MDILCIAVPTDTGDEHVPPGTWRFRLYIAGVTRRSTTAYATLKQLCDQYLPDQHAIEVIDVRQEPERLGDGVVVLPTVVRLEPLPVRRLVSGLSDVQTLAAELDLPSPPAG